MVNPSFYKQTTLPDFSNERSSFPPLPQQIGPYKIEGLLSKGGMSLLYLGVDSQTKQPLALKVLSPDYVTHPEATERFLKESQIIGMTHHPNIVKLYGQGEWEGGLYISMELIRGISLRQFIIQHSLSLKRCLEIILQVAFALCHLHTHGVIHRDLKPENILITEDGEVKVIDFGIAQLHEEKPLSPPLVDKAFLGTPDYMSPEQKEDPQSVSYASDIYSLGIIAYELILGKLSFGVINPSLLPKGLRKIIEKSLAVSTQERYQDVVDLITDISQYLKSGEWEKERPGSDQLKEFLEQIQKAEQALSPPQTPQWPALDIGVAKYKSPGQAGYYYDFFKISHNFTLILLAQTLSASTVESPLNLSSLRGMIQLFIYEKISSSQIPFHIDSLITPLNALLCQDRIPQHFGITLLLLDPMRDQLSTLCCGMNPVLHIELGNKEPRKLGVPTPPLGKDPMANFSSTLDNWNVGDTLLIHSLPSSAFGESNPEGELEKRLLQAVSETALISPQHQPEGILKKMALFPPFAALSCPKVVISIQRIS